MEKEDFDFLRMPIKSVSKNLSKLGQVLFLVEWRCWKKRCGRADGWGINCFWSDAWTKVLMITYDGTVRI